MQTVHSQHVDAVEKQLVEQGYKILGRNVKIDNIIIRDTFITVDLLTEKNGVRIPVECGRIHPPKQERMAKLKEKFGTILHMPYGCREKKLLKKQRREREEMMLENERLKKVRVTVESIEAEKAQAQSEEE